MPDEPEALGLLAPAAAHRCTNRRPPDVQGGLVRAGRPGPLALGRRGDRAGPGPARPGGPAHGSRPPGAAGTSCRRASRPSTPSRRPGRTPTGPRWSPSTTACSGLAQPGRGRQPRGRGGDGRRPPGRVVGLGRDRAATPRSTATTTCPPPGRPARRLGRADEAAAGTAALARPRRTTRSGPSCAGGSTRRSEPGARPYDWLAPALGAARRTGGAGARGRSRRWPRCSSQPTRTSVQSRRHRPPSPPGPAGRPATPPWPGPASRRARRGSRPGPRTRRPRPSSSSEAVDVDVGRLGHRRPPAARTRPRPDRTAPAGPCPSRRRRAAGARRRLRGPPARGRPTSTTTNPTPGWVDQARAPAPGNRSVSSSQGEPVVLAGDVDEAEVAGAEDQELVGAGRRSSSAGPSAAARHLAGSPGGLAGTRPVRRAVEGPPQDRVALPPARRSNAFTPPGALGARRRSRPSRGVCQPARPASRGPRRTGRAKTSPCDCPWSESTTKR